MFIRIHEGYQIKPSKVISTAYIVVTDGKGGKIPNVLSGMFSSVTEAVKSIDLYLSAKELKNGEKRSQSGI
jgi:hypothetical protein